MALVRKLEKEKVVKLKDAVAITKIENGKKKLLKRQATLNARMMPNSRRGDRLGDC